MYIALVKVTNIRKNVYSTFLSKLMNKDRLTPQGLKSSMDTILSIKRMANTVDLSKAMPHYDYLMKEGNDFNLPIKYGGASNTSTTTTPLDDTMPMEMSAVKASLGELKKIIFKQKRHNKMGRLTAALSSNASPPPPPPICHRPVEMNGNHNISKEDCEVFCGTETASVIYGVGAILGEDVLYPNRTYCYYDSIKDDSRSSCSSVTGQLVFSVNDNTFSCHCRYPFLFGGRDCSENVACVFNPKKHRKNPNWKNETFLVDEKSNLQILDHTDMRNSSLYTKLEDASLEDYIAYINDKDFFLKNRISCHCPGQLDYLGNPLPPTPKKYNNFTECHINPCALTNLDMDRVVTYNPEDYTCNPKEGFYNVVMNRSDTPISNTMSPMFGIRTRQVHPKVTSFSLKNMSKFTQKNVELATAHSSPIVTPSRDDKNRYILYLSPDQINIGGGGGGGDLTKWFGVQAWYSMFGDSLPNLTRNPVNATTAFIFFPVENVLANHNPQNPIDFQLMAAQALENSKMLSGIVVGGHENLFHSIFEGESPSYAKHRAMLNLFKLTRIDRGRIMTSSRIPPVTNSIFLSRASILSPSPSPSEEAKFFKSAHFIRSYRTYGLLMGLANIDDDYNVNPLTTPNGVIRWAFPTSHHTLSPEDHLYPNSYKLDNSLRLSEPLRSDESFTLSFWSN